MTAQPARSPTSTKSNAVPNAENNASKALECDVIMKGGITSGVIYPAALDEFMETYRLRQLGGASAGAIGAAFGAAAEFGRKAGGRERLRAVPEQLKGGALLRMFQPSKGTRVLFDVLTAVVAKDAVGAPLPTRRRIALALGHVALRFWWLTAICALSLAAWIIAGAFRGGPLAWVLIATALIVLPVTWVTAVVLLLVRRIGHDVPDNNFGICTGLQLPASPHKGFTDWLTDTIDDLAGRPVGNRDDPLTFADLKRSGNDDDPDVDERPITLRLMTSCLSYTRPYEMPLGSLGYFYEESAWKKLFPARVMSYLSRVRTPPPKVKEAEWMWEARIAAGAHSPHRDRDPSSGEIAQRVSGVTETKELSAERAARRRGQEFARGTFEARANRLAEPRTPHPRLKPLPAGLSLPIIVAVRMSMSFPGLISAIPLWVVKQDSARTSLAQDIFNAGDEELARDIGLDFEHLWFSDGGLCSNFPIHLFDAPLPKRPTFAINLDQFSNDDDRNPDEDWDFQDTANVAREVKQNYIYPRDNYGGLFPTYHPIRQGGLRTVGGFATLMLTTSRTWHDNYVLTAPGYRDRIVRVHQTRGEGGINLSMSDATIDRLVERGRFAARSLATQFTSPRSFHDGRFTGWDNHRWYRYRSLIGTLPTFLKKFREGYAVLTDLDPADPPSLRVSPEVLDLDQRITKALISLESIVTPALAGSSTRYFEDSPATVGDAIARRPADAGVLGRWPEG